MSSASPWSWVGRCCTTRRLAEAETDFREGPFGVEASAHDVGRTGLEQLVRLGHRVITGGDSVSRDVHPGAPRDAGPAHDGVAAGVSTTAPPYAGTAGSSLRFTIRARTACSA
jgi:hypothetical protein